MVGREKHDAEAIISKPRDAKVLQAKRALSPMLDRGLTYTLVQQLGAGHYRLPAPGTRRVVELLDVSKAQAQL